jgi:hypothetical protein
MITVAEDRSRYYVSIDDPSNPNALSFLRDKILNMSIYMFPDYNDPFYFCGRNDKNFDALYNEFITRAGSYPINFSITRPSVEKDIHISFPQLSKKISSKKTQYSPEELGVPQKIITDEAQEIIMDEALDINDLYWEPINIEYEKQKIEELIQELNETKIDLEYTRQMLIRSYDEINSLTSLNFSLTDDISIESRESISNRTRIILISTSRSNSNFISLLDKLSVTKSLPLDVGVELERTLRAILKCPNKNIGLNDLIMQASNNGILTQEGRHLAHLIRNQRNIVAHGGVDEQTWEAKSYLTLFAAALLWCELAEEDRQ